MATKTFLIQFIPAKWHDNDPLRQHGTLNCYDEYGDLRWSVRTMSRNIAELGSAVALGEEIRMREENRKIVGKA
jgi:hypothetical protein